MQAELVYTTTSDGVRLDGAFFAPQNLAPADRAVDAMLLVHGSGGTFYRPYLLHQAARLRAAGYAVASFNTRGHDLVWWSGEQFFGNAYEILDQCRLDLNAAITWLAERGYRRIGTLGVSMGAVKVVYYQAHVQDPRAAAVMAVSPVRLSHSYYLASEAAGEYQKWYQQARELVESGQPEALFRPTFPVPVIYGAASYIDKHGPEERYNLLRYANKVNCPLFLIAGTLETHPRLRDCAQDVYNTVQDNPNATCVIVEGADHAFPRMEERLADELLQWLGQLKAGQIPAAKTG